MMVLYFAVMEGDSAVSAGKWRENWAEKVHTPDEMVHFVDAVGCCTGKPLLRYPDFPSQYEALGEVSPGVPDTWFWKDDLHTEKRIYYTRVFGGQPGFLSYPLLPVLIATNGAVADELIFNGLLPPEAQQVYRAIEEYGPISTIDLKRMLTPDAKHSADRVLINLDRQFIITKVGITGRTLGTYSYIWDLVERWVPEMLTAADRLGRKQAESVLREHLAAFGIPSDSSFYAKVLRLQKSKGI
ncbi:MAG: hypothetical protein ABFD64_02120 [Armatimonadota bacterium]